MTLVEERLQDITILMHVCYGEGSQAVIRADETAAALQRLKWELERVKLPKRAAASVCRTLRGTRSGHFLPLDCASRLASFQP